EAFLSNYALINLQPPLARLPGVGQVNILGAGPYSMRVWLDPAKLRTYGLTAVDVKEAIEHQNVQVASGQVGGPPTAADQLLQLTVSGVVGLPAGGEFERIVVKSAPPPGKPTSDNPAETASLVRLRDVGTVELGQQVFSVFSRLNGKKAAHVAIFAL